MKRIFLIGYMGSGKTTVGLDLARKLKLSFIDLDTHIEERFHKTVKQIFAEKGEESFRKIEQNMLHEVAEFEDVVISAGGGTPCFFDNMDYMNEKGTTIFLDVPPEELVRRLDSARHTRPVLKDLRGDALLQFVNENLEKRMPFYSKASKRADASSLDSAEEIDKVAESIIKLTE
jgi:shikimate kinase